VNVTQYHSLCGKIDSIPDCLIVTAIASAVKGDKHLLEVASQSAQLRAKNNNINSNCSDSENVTAIASAGKSAGIDKSLLEETYRTQGKLLSIMGVRHKQYCMEGVQFHPESITTEKGYEMIRNFLTWTHGTWAEHR
jgi:anthranilate/para-aminobenzoate synthase component II